MYLKLFTLLFLIGLTGCTVLSSHPTSSGRYQYKKDAHPTHVPNHLIHIPDAIPQLEPKSRYGNPKKYTVLNKTYYTLPSNRGYQEKGLASWYGKKFHGHKTSNGETYNMFGMSAAHKTLPLPTYASVKNLKNGKKVIVKINDRGPFHENRLIDLSYTAAKKLGILEKGTAWVEVTALDPIAYHQKQQNQRPPLKFAKKTTHQDNAQQTYLQLGAFSNKMNAKNLVEKLKERLQLEAIIHETQQKNQRLFLVNIGPIALAEKITYLTNKIKEAQFPQPIKILR